MNMGAWNTARIILIERLEIIRVRGEKLII